MGRGTRHAIRGALDTHRKRGGKVPVLPALGGGCEEEGGREGGRGLFLLLPSSLMMICVGGWGKQFFLANLSVC